MPRRLAEPAPKDTLDAMFKSEPRDDVEVPEPVESEDEAILGDAWEYDDPAFRDASASIYRLNDDGTPPPGNRLGAFVKKWNGPLDQEKLRDAIGGGLFRVIVKMPDRRRKVLTINLEGPRIVPPATIPAPASAYPAPPPTERDRVIDELRQELRDLRAVITTPPVAQVDPFAMFARALEFARGLVPPAPPMPMEAMLGMFERGFRMGERAEGGMGIGEVVKDILPLVSKAIDSQRPRDASVAPLPGIAPARVNGPTDDPQKRLTMFAAMIAAAQRSMTTPEAFAHECRAKLLASEVDDLRAANVDVVLQAMGVGRVAEYSLDSQVSRDYIGRTLEALRGTVEPNDDDDLEDEDDDGFEDEDET
jgi:hypothetical protein